MVGEQYTLPRSGLLEQISRADGVKIAVLRKCRAKLELILAAAHLKRYFYNQISEK